MKINEVEKIVGINAANIRYYEKAGLVTPARNEENGYRDYSDADVRRLNQIKMLRLLDVSVEDIRKLMEGSVSMETVMNKRLGELSEAEQAIAESRAICSKILAEGIEASDLSDELFEDNRAVWADRLEVVKKKDMTYREFGLKFRILSALLGIAVPTNVEYNDTDEVIPERIGVDKDAMTLGDMLNGRGGRSGKIIARIFVVIVVVVAVTFAVMRWSGILGILCE